MGLQKQEMPVGTKVRGWGLLNEYGQFDFTPEQTGVRQGTVKRIKEGENFSLSETKDRIIVHVSFKKQGTKLKNLAEFCKQIDELIKFFNEYDF